MSDDKPHIYVITSSISFGTWASSSSSSSNSNPFLVLICLINFVSGTIYNNALPNSITYTSLMARLESGTSSSIWNPLTQRWWQYVYWSRRWEWVAERGGNDSKTELVWVGKGRWIQFQDWFSNVCLNGCSFV